MKYSVIDVSSSSLSLIVAAADEHKTEILFKDRLGISLVNYLDGRKFTERGIAKLVDCLKEMKETCISLGVERCYLISTAALRYIENFDEVRARVQAETGFVVNFIDAATEAYCDFISNIYYSTYDRPVLVDLGGKSIEVCDLSARCKEEMSFFSFGLLDLYRKYVSNIFPTEKEAKEIREFVKDKFDRADLPGEGTYATVIMVGATNAAIYDVYADYCREKCDGGVRTIERKKFKKLAKHLLTGHDRSKLVLSNAPEKLYLIGSAVVVLRTLFKRFGAETVVVSDRGVKEGYLQLVLEGKETGRWYDFATGEVGGEERAAEQTFEAATSQKKRKKKSGSDTEKDSAQAEKTADVSGASEDSTAGQTAAPAAPKKRGRPKKADAEAAKTEGSAAPKKRGRPKKEVSVSVSENKTEEALKEAEREGKESGEPL